jgi:glycosyltransferase involved in cell wall biosynthesis
MLEFLGLRRDIPQLLAAMDAFVLPSDQEGFSNALIEAMAAGVPVVVSDHQGNLEAVEPEVSGLVFPQGDAAALRNCLREILQHPARAQELREAAHRRVAANFTVEQYGRRLQGIYDRLVRQRLDPTW